MIELCITALMTGAAFAADAPYQEEKQLLSSEQEAAIAAAAASANSEAANQMPVVQISSTTKAAPAATVSITPNRPVAPGASKASSIPATVQPVTLPASTTASAPVTVKQPVQKKTAAPVKKQSTEKKITINLASRIMTLYEGNTKIRMYPVGVGKVSTPTPIGYYSIQDKTVDPVWISPDNPEVHIDSGEDNPLGYRWMSFYGNYGMHGTNHPESIGGYVSNGCVRMHEEDVEDLYPLVSVGTPVEVYYDRIVIDRDADHTISYYIYPDGYGRQPLEVADVQKALAGYGVENFEGDSAIAAKIAASDGNPTYVAKVYTLVVNGKTLPLRALRKGGITYLPAAAIAQAVNVSVGWQDQTGLLVSTYGQAPGYVRRDVVYCTSDALPVLFHLAGGLNSDLVYVLHSTDTVATVKK